MVGVNGMATSWIIGAVILAIVPVLLKFACHFTSAPLEELPIAMTGRYSEGTMWYFIIGVATAVGGGLLAVFGGRKRNVTVTRSAGGK